MADDPRIFLTEPVGGNLAAFSAAEYVLSPYSGGSGGPPEKASLLYLLQDGRVVASRTPVMSARLIAYAQSEAPQIYVDENGEGYMDENGELYAGN